MAVLLTLLALLPSLAGCTALGHRSTPLRLESETIEGLADSVFEVVIPKREEQGITYANGRKLPTDELPYSERSDKYYGVGTAFAVAADRFVSAAHVFQLDVFATDREFYLRDRHGKVHAVAKVLRYSQYRDLVEFTLAETLPEVQPLSFDTATQVGERVYTVGNANGEGIAVRDGQIASYTFEPVKGAWKDLRYSAAASPGNSGGPLLDTAGHVVGVVVRKNENENLNVAVPIAELSRLSAETAEFFVASSEANTDGEPTRDWSFQAALPAALDVLAGKAEASRRQFHLSQWRAALAESRAKSFPDDPMLADYVWNQNYSPLVQTLALDSKDGYRPTPDAPEFERTTAGGEVVSAMVGDPDYDLATVEIPAKEQVADYVKKPEKILAVLFEAFDFYRDFNGRHIPLKAFGPPQVSSVFTDQLGRPWLKAVWRTWYNEGSLLLNCLPTPVGFGCSLDNVATWEETYGLQEKFEEYYAALITQSYSGSVGEWRRFLALGDRYVPKPLRGLELEAGKGRMRFQGGDFHLAYAQPLAGEGSRLFVGVGYGMQSVLNTEIHSVKLDHGADLGVSEQFDMYLEPPAAAASADRTFWTSLTKKKDKARDDDGSVYRVLGLKALKNGRNVVETVACRGPGRKPSSTVVRTCDGIRRAAGGAR